MGFAGARLAQDYFSDGIVSRPLCTRYKVIHDLIDEISVQFIDLKDWVGPDTLEGVCPIEVDGTKCLQRFIHFVIQRTYMVRL